MGRIIDPTKPAPAAPTMAQWLNAFTCIQECSADAADNPEIKRSVADNIKMLRARVAENADPQAGNMLAQQELIQRQMFAKRPEMYQMLIGLWHKAAVEIKAFDWDLSQDVHYQEEFKGGRLLFWQGAADETDVSKKQAVIRPIAVMIIKFLKFVKQMSETSDPIEYTKEILLKQGINEHNFDLYADQLAFPNPWTAQR